MDNPYLRAKTNFIFEAMSKGEIPSHMKFEFKDRSEYVKVYTDEKSAIDNFYNDTFIVIILFYDDVKERNQSKGWNRVCGETIFQKTGGTKQYGLENTKSIFNGSIALSYITVSKRDYSKPRILQNEIEYPAYPRESSKPRGPEYLQCNMVPQPGSVIIKTPNLDLIRVVIRNYYEKDSKRTVAPNRQKIIQYHQHSLPKIIKNKKNKTKMVRVQSMPGRNLNINEGHPKPNNYKLNTSTITSYSNQNFESDYSLLFNQYNYRNSYSQSESQISNSPSPPSALQDLYYCTISDQMQLYGRDQQQFYQQRGTGVIEGGAVNKHPMLSFTNEHTSTSSYVHYQSQNQNHNHFNHHNHFHLYDQQ